MVFQPPFCSIYVNTYNSTRVANHKELAFKYFRGEISREEEHALLDWIKEEDANLLALHNWEEEWNASENSVIDDKWEQMLGRISARQALEEGEIRIRRRRSPLWIPFAIAASLLLVAGSIFFFRPSEPQMFAMEAPSGEKCRMTLPDSTVVWLNSGSTITFDDSFNRKERSVKLTGEGYFDVHHDAEKPFIVNCGDVTVLVRGTKFNIEAYPETRYVSTSVVEGHVEFAHGFAHIDLYDGQSARYDLLSKVFSRSSGDTNDACAWTESRFTYDGINLHELAEKLSRTYAVRFHFNTTDSLKYKFNISLRNNESLPEVMSALERIIPVRIKIDGDNVYINDR